MAGSRIVWGRYVLLVIPALLMALAAFSVVATPVSAQEQPRKSRNLLEFLFGGGQKAEPVKKRPAARSKSRRKTSTRTRTRSAPSPEPEVKIVEKAETAKTILVVGDFMGGGLADALVTVFADNPEIRVVDRTNGSSGFVRDDFYDWPDSIGAIVEEEKPAAIVVMIGSNDRQEMRTQGRRERLLSEKWMKEYEQRAQKFAEEISSRKVPFVWIGQPAFRYKKMLSDMLVFNDVYSRAADSVGATFVDIWDGFVDENGAYMSVGPDINGQPVRLRSDDGINLTSAGKRKIAFYAEKPLRKVLDLAATPGGAAPGVAALPESGEEPEALAPIDRTLPVSLSDPELEGNAELLGLNTTPKSKARTAAERLAIEGIAPEAAPGRADDFLGRPLPAPAQATRPDRNDTTTAIRR